MDILNKIHNYAKCAPGRRAIVSGDVSLTYKQLEEYSDHLAGYLYHTYGEGTAPIVVYGHKQPAMLVCFLACVKAGRAYCPVDISVPLSRTTSIIEAAKPPVILCVSPLDCPEGYPVAGADALDDICQSFPAACPDDCRVSGDDSFYIIFTSGSTGTPKGVQISCDCLNHFLDWACDLGISREEKCGTTFLNQAPFSFDLSVMDVYTCLACGGTLWTLAKEIQSDYRRMFDVMRASQAKVWVSTPSFADICLADKTFCSELLPQLGVFLFCGETLTNHTALALLERFPGSLVVNTYGPTESTVALTNVTVTKDLAQSTSPLPVGRVKPGSSIEIWDAGGHPVPDGTQGEIVLLGDTVSTGYLGRPDLTARSFFDGSQAGNKVRGYHSGDKGYLKDGMLYYCGRIDLQIKLHGYRIEIEDIESNLMKLPDIKQAAVTPNLKDGKVKSLTAYVVCGCEVANPRETAAALKCQLKTYVPDYMVPKKFVFLPKLPMTANGKCDRKKLEEISL